MRKSDIANVRQRTNHTFIWTLLYSLILMIGAAIVLQIVPNMNQGLVMMILVVVGVFIVYISNITRWPFELENHDENKKQMTPTRFFIMLCLVFTCQLLTYLFMQLYLLTGLPEANIAGESLAQDLSLPMILYASFIGPIAEELIYRGFLIGSLKKNSKIVAIVISAICFGLMHANPMQFFAGFFSGLLFGYIFIEYSIKWTILFHIFNNFLLSELPLLIFGADSSVIIDYVILGIGIVLTVIAVIYLVKKKVISTFLKNPANHGEKGAIKQTLSSAWMWIYMATQLVFMASVIWGSSSGLLGK